MRRTDAMCGLLFVAVLSFPVFADCQSEQHEESRKCASEYSSPEKPATAVERAIRSERRSFFPELRDVDVSVRTFRSDSDFFRSRFSLVRYFFLLHMKYYIEGNSTAFARGLPEDGLCAIVAHELSHIITLSRGNRIRRFGLIRLLSKKHTAVFERRADLAAIGRGYGEGLKSYRHWLYGHIPPDKVEMKRRNYFSPEEIEAMEKRLEADPTLLEKWAKHVPKNLAEIEAQRE